MRTTSPTSRARRRGLVAAVAVAVVVAIGGVVIAVLDSDDATPVSAPGADRPADLTAAGAGVIGEPAATPTPTPTPTKAPVKPGNPGSCPMPANSVWRADISKLPVHSRSAAYVAGMGPDRAMHPDFGSGTLEDGHPFGIPITAVPAGTAGVKGHFTYDDESDAGPYAIPRNARIEGGSDADGDRHVIALDSRRCRVYELFNATPRADGGWDADSGAIFDLGSNRMRPLGYTSADAAGLSIYAGLVRYDEVAAGRINHALRMTVQRTQRAYVWPASHYASSNTDPNLPPMGLRFRLKANVDISKLPPQARVIAQALKTYGAIVADNGSNWFFTGTQDNRWNNDQLRALKTLRGSDFEAVDESSLMKSRNSYEVR